MRSHLLFSSIAGSNQLGKPARLRSKGHNAGSGMAIPCFVFSLFLFPEGNDWAAHSRQDDQQSLTSLQRGNIALLSSHSQAVQSPRATLDSLPPGKRRRKNVDPLKHKMEPVSKHAERRTLHLFNEQRTHRETHRASSKVASE